jgi:hypothetical protein
MQEQKMDFVCFQETIMKDFAESTLRMVDYRLYLWDWIPANGRSGGVLTGINSDKYDVGIRKQGDFILQHTLWDKQLAVEWALLNVYGAPHDERREAFLAELASFCSKTPDPYIVGGGGGI